jgi:hypothetical protein
MDRFGIKLTDQLRNTLVKKIQACQGHCVEKQSNRVSVWDVNHEGHEFRLVYDKVHKTLVTFLKRDMNPDFSKGRIFDF